MFNITIEIMDLEDLELISPILLSDFDDFWTVSTLKQELKNDNSYYFVAKIDNNIVGFAGIWKAVDDVHITDIVVKKDFRSLGIGSILLEHLINVSKNLDNITSITLEVNEENKIAQNLYKKYNFIPVGIRKNYYGVDKHAIIMTRDL